MVLPQLRPALLGGVLLVGLHLLAEFGALQLLRYPTFTTAIYDLYGSTFNGAAANMIAGVLVLCCLLLLLPSSGCAAGAGSPASARCGAGGGAGAARGCAVAGHRRRSSGWSALSVGVPTYALVHWLRVGASTEFPLAELAEAAGSTAASWPASAPR